MAVTPASGRHPLPSPDDICDDAGRLGIGNDTRVVCYDGGSGAFAARLWWMLDWVGHEAVAVLDGGFAAWVAEDRPVSVDPTPAPGRGDICSTAAAGEGPRRGGRHAARSRAGETLVDLRGAERFAGEVEPIDAVAGHVPGAVNLPYPENLAPRTAASARPAELAALWRARAGATPGRAPVCMCGSGVTACQGLLALEAAGIRGGRLYAGSWSEWIRDPSRPIARGAA